MAVRSITAGAGRMIFAVRSAAMTPATIGAPRSVLQADCAAASIIKGRSALLGRSQAERCREHERMIGHCLRPSRVIGEGGGRKPQMRRQPLDKDGDRLLHLRQTDAGMAK